MFSGMLNILYIEGYVASMTDRAFGGNAVGRNLSVGLSVKSSYKSKNGEWKDFTDWPYISFTGPAREKAYATSLSVGDRVIITAKLRTFETKDNGTRLSIQALDLARVASDIEDKWNDQALADAEAYIGDRKEVKLLGPRKATYKAHGELNLDAVSQQDQEIEKIPF